MTSARRKRLEAAGAKVTTVSELLNLTPEDEAHIEARLAVPKPRAKKKLVRAEQQAFTAIAEVLTDTLKASGRTQRQLAATLDLSQARISQILNGKGNLTVRSLARIAEALDYTLQIRFIKRKD